MQGHSSTNIKGIDVSEHNGAVNWADVHKAGMVFAICKATEGATYHDPTFATNYKGAKAAGLIRGAYCFARPKTSSAIDEANNYVAVVNAQGGFDDLPPILDMEDHGGLSPAALTAWVMTWMNRVKELTGMQPILYTYGDFAKNHLLASLSSIPLWIAAYQTTPPANVNGWTKWLMWQFTDKYKIGNGTFDASEFDGTKQDLINFCKNKGGLNLMQIGDKGDAVKQLQEELKLVLGLDSKFVVDGVYGSATAAAVKSFQTQFHVQPVDGIAGSVTMAALAKVVAAKKASTPTSAPAPAAQTQKSATPSPAPQPAQQASVNLAVVSTSAPSDAVSQAEAALKQAIANEIAKAQAAQAQADAAMKQVADAQAALKAMQDKMANAQKLMQSALDALK